MVHRRDLKGEILVFGNQGALWGNAMTWWDHDTGSIWSQPLGESIIGPRKGQSLQPYPSTLTTWGAWKEKHAGTQALAVHGWATGFQLEHMAIAVDFGSESAAYLIPALRDVGVINDEVAGVPLAVVIDPEDDERWSVFSRELDDVGVELNLTADGLVDTVSGTVFDPFTGVGFSGPLSDQNLDKLSAFTIFPADYGTFFPDGRTWPS